MAELYQLISAGQAAKVLFAVMAKKEATTEIGKAIRRLRLERSLSMKKLGSLVGMQEAAVFKLETDPKNRPRLDTLQKLAGALGVTVAELVKDVPVIPPQDTAAVN